MGSSPRSDAASSFYQSALNYQPAFNPTDYMKNIDAYFNQGQKALDTSYSGAINRSTKSATQRLAGQGITGGATVEDTIKSANNPIYSSKASATQGLETSRAGAKVTAMDTINNEKYKKMLLTLQSIGGLDSTNTWDDIFGGLTAGANVFSPIAKALNLGGQNK
jgi:hypothetical protein